MSVLITSDIHMDDKTINADRWNLWSWIREQVKKYNVEIVLILGDLTEAKDKHSAVLVNRFVKETADLARLCKVVFIKGNHDYVDEKNPFFRFLNQLPNVAFYTKPKVLKDDWLLLPNTKNWKEDWNWYLGRLDDFSMIFCHQTFEGAEAENGTVLGGISPLVFKGYKGKVYSGDVHVPQDISKIITYIGAPYHIRFGDSFKARVLLLQDGGERTKDLYFPARGRETLVCRNLSDLQKVDLLIGTQVKVRALLKRSEYPEWPALRKDIISLCERRGWELCGAELKVLKFQEKEVSPEVVSAASLPEDVVKLHIEEKKLPRKLGDIGLELLQESQE